MSSSVSHRLTGGPISTTSRRAFTGALLLVCLGLPATGQEPAGNSAIRPEPRDGGWKSMHESFLKRTKEGPIDLLFLGDSITAGWAGQKEVWDRYYGSRRAANFGIGGDRTQHVLWRIENGEVEGIAPKVAVLMIGTNNMSGNTPAEIAQGIEAIVKTLRAKLPQTKVLLLGVFPRAPKGDALRDRVKAVNDQIARLDDGKTIRYLDIGPRFLEPDGTLTREIMPDLLHLSRKGYRIWADAIEPTLWTMLEAR